MNLDDLAKLIPAAAWRLSEDDTDPLETREWIEALDALIAAEGPERATFLLRRLLQHARARRVPLPQVLATPYVNTIGARRAAAVPGQPRDRGAALGAGALERARDGGARQPRVGRAGRPHRELRLGGGPLRGRLQPLLPRRASGGDLVYFQPHSAPGVYARAFLEGRLTEENLDNYRRETGGQGPLLVSAIRG